MRRFIPLIAVGMMISVSAISFAQEFTSKQDHFKVNFPGQPRVTETTWKSSQEADLPARVYTSIQGQIRHTFTVVDYTKAQEMLTAMAKDCPPRLARCNGLTAYGGAGYWKIDVRGALIYATWQFMQRDAKLTQLRWTTSLNKTEGYELELINNPDKSRTFATMYMYENRLYIMESTGPANFQAPASFHSSLMFLDDDGRPASHAGMYFNGARIAPYEKSGPGCAGDPNSESILVNTDVNTRRD